MTQAQAMAITRGYEGCRLRAYTDSRGNLTIGVGHLLCEGSTVKEITQEVADSTFSTDWCEAHQRAQVRQRALLGGVAEDEFRARFLDGGMTSRDVALTDLEFNLGGGGVDRFRGMLAAIREGDWILAGDELVFVNPAVVPLVSTPYARQVGRRATDNAYRLRTNSEPEDE